MRDANSDMYLTGIQRLLALVRKQNCPNESVKLNKLLVEEGLLYFKSTVRGKEIDG